METTETKTELEQMADKINAALIAGGYKPAEARASAWTKEVKPGQKLERIYLSGRKANGFVHQVSGVWTAEGIKFVMLNNLVKKAVQA